MTFSRGTLLLEYFGSGELLAVAITTLVLLVLIFYMDCPCLCNDDIKSENADNKHTRGGGHVKLLHNSNCSSYPLIIHIN